MSIQIIAPRNPGPETENVLIVEYFNEICLVFHLVPGTKDIEVACVNSFAEFERCLRRKVPSLMLLGNRMAAMFGPDSIKSVAVNHPSTKIVVVEGASKTSSLITSKPN